MTTKRQRLLSLYDFWTATHADGSPEIRGRMLATIAARPAALILGFCSTSATALTAVVLIHSYWPFFWLAMDLALTVYRLGVLARARWNPNNLREQDHACLLLAGLTWAILFGIAVAWLAASGNPTLMILASINTAGVVGVVSSRNSPTLRLAALIIVVASLPWAIVMGVSHPPGMFMVPLLMPIWIGGMFVVLIQNNHIAVRMFRAEDVALTLAKTDPLTGLHNRVFLYEMLEAWCGDPFDESSTFSLLCIDLDGFKRINDTHGHLFGDRVLKAFAERLREILRSTGFACRYGGDEFVILLPQTNRMRAARVARLLAKRLRFRFKLEGYQAVLMNFSIGGTSRADSGQTPLTLLHAADRNLYRSKKMGEGNYCDDP